MKIRTAIAIASLLSPLGAAARVVPLGTEFQVNSYTVYDQRSPAVAAGADGVFVVWDSYKQDGSHNTYGVFGQRYNSVGQAEGTEFQIDTYRVSGQRRPAVAVGSGGDFVVAWESLGQDRSANGVFARRYDSAGKAMGKQFQVNSYTIGDQGRPVLAAGADGVFVVVWQNYLHENYGFDVIGQRLFAEPVPCAGDCNGNSALSVDELITGVAIALGQLPIQNCAALDIDEGGQVTIDELVAAVDAALNGCTD